MRLLKIGDRDEIRFTDDLTADIPPYAILSHTWGPDQEEVTFKDLIDGLGKTKRVTPKFGSARTKRERMACDISGSIHAVSTRRTRLNSPKRSCLCTVLAV